MVWPSEIHSLILSSPHRKLPKFVVFYADAVKKKRVERLMSQKDLARVAHTTIVAVRRIEEEKPVKVSTARKIFSFFGIEPILKLN